MFLRLLGNVNSGTITAEDAHISDGENYDAQEQPDNDVGGASDHHLSAAVGNSTNSTAQHDQQPYGADLFRIPSGPLWGVVKSQ